MVLIAVMCTAIGTAVGSVLQDMQGFQLIMNFIVLPLFFFSSELYPVPDLRGAVRLAVRLNPLSYGVDGLRGALSGGFAFCAQQTSRCSAASPRSCSRSGPTCSRRSRYSPRPDDQLAAMFEKPTAADITTEKKLTKAANATRDSLLVSGHTTNKGASAIFGIDWSVTRLG
jgi:hypothetical protein